MSTFRQPAAAGILRDGQPLDTTLPFALPPAGAYPGHGYQRIEDEGLIIERDVAVTLRDGAKMYVDVYRPQTNEPVPVLIGWSPYGKHSPQKMDMLPGADVDMSKLSKYTAWEAPDPVWWGKQGYALVIPDPRGTWSSEGIASYFNHDEAKDEYDLIEWAAVQPWCNSKVGLSGVSYLAVSQWFVGAQQPPHLTAMMPWEGFSDQYREFCFHGGIPERTFMPSWTWGAAFSLSQVENLVANCAAHPLLDDFWKAKQIDFSKITVPIYVVASWTDHGLHTRGTLEAFKAIGSQQKWLEIHGRKKWAYFYEEESVQRQLAFWDHFLKGKNSGIEYWPKVRYEVRQQYYKGQWRADTDWPLPATQYRSLYLDASTGRFSGQLRETPVTTVAQVSYDALAQDDRVVFDYTFKQAAELVGHSKLRLWVQTEGANDADLFVGIEKLDRSGQRVDFPFFSIREDGAVALGWLRVSHREQDAARSTPQQPWLKHEREQLLQPGDIVPVDIEILPSGTRFEAGETLRLVIQGTEIRKYPFPPPASSSDRNQGRHIVHTGGRYDAHLLLPFISG